MVANAAAPATTTSAAYSPTSQHPSTVITTTATTSDLTLNATTPSATISPQQPSVVPGAAGNQNDGITTVVNSVLCRIGIIMDNFKNSSSPLVQSVLDEFQDSQEKLKQQINKLLALTA
uniref:Transcription initiation factor TFIID subunit 12 n=1 Tax=Ascaris lumbricoides TaxID=6252 RepID=A0A0M3HVR0_ASCLU